ncbi:hypothetical protein HD806DRAFT_511541 [Xylariaceae sp. AK1471]|nr:hypothetical protein HD806DRAFT_511541 [Xylariaceae sp. AK1471]
MPATSLSSPSQLLQRSREVLRRDRLPPAAVSVVAPITLFFILAITCLGLRLWSIRLKKTTLRFSDYAILFAAVLAAGYLALTWLVADAGGLGRPAIELSFSEQELSRKAFIVAFLIQGWANSFVRLSILAFFRQIFPGRPFRIAVTAVQAAAVAYLVAITIGFAAICRPFWRNVDITPQQVEYCGNQYLQFLLSAIFNLLLDLLIITLPMPVLWRLQLNTRRKYSLIFVFGLGIFVCFATGWRIYQVVLVSDRNKQKDFAASVVGDALWSGLEINLGIINACLPLMPPALQKLGSIIPFPKRAAALWLTFPTWRSTPTKASGSLPLDDKEMAVGNWSQNRSNNRDGGGGDVGGDYDNGYGYSDGYTPSSQGQGGGRIMRTDNTDAAARSRFAEHDEAYFHVPMPAETFHPQRPSSSAGYGSQC